MSKVADAANKIVELPPVPSRQYSTNRFSSCGVICFKQCDNNAARYETGDEPQLGKRRIHVLRQIEQNINCMNFITGNNGREKVS